MQLAKKGAKVYVAGRSTQKGAAAVEKIRSATGASDQNVQFMELDLADIKKTKAAAETFFGDFSAFEYLGQQCRIHGLRILSYTPRQIRVTHSVSLSGFSYSVLKY